MKDTKIVNIKALASILVVLGHSIIIYSSVWNLYDTNQVSVFFDFLKKIINVIQMPLFFSVSGYLLYYSLRKEKKFIKFVQDKFLRLLIPYAIFYFAWMVPIRMLIDYPGYQNQSLFSIYIKNFFLGIDAGHLWFLPTLFFIFILLYYVFIFMKRKIKHQTIYCIGIFIILFLLSIYSQTFIFQVPIINFVMQYGAWFFLGFLVHDKLDKKYLEYQLIKWGVGITSIILLVLSLCYGNAILHFVTAFFLIIAIYS